MLDIRSCQRGVMNKAIPIYYWRLISVFSGKKNKKERSNSKHILELRKFTNPIANYFPPPLEKKA